MAAPRGAARTRRDACRGALALGGAPAMAKGARARGPEPRRIVVNFPPGGQLDGVARLPAGRAQRDGRAPFVVENRPGAGGNIGAAAVARARPGAEAAGWAALVRAVLDAPATAARLTEWGANAEGSDAAAGCAWNNPGNAEGPGGYPPGPSH